MIKYHTAAELADMLDGMIHYPHNTGGLSMLDDATLAFGIRDVGIHTAHQAFANARHRHQRSYDSRIGGYSQKAWEQAMVAAGDLAALLRPLGSHRIARCERPAGWGTCGLPLDDDGTCRSSLGHTDDDQ